MIKTKHLLTVLVVFEAAIIGLLLASRYQITVTPTALPKAPARKKRRAPTKKSLPGAAKAPPRISSN
jgi:hypothetical protein